MSALLKTVLFGLIAATTVAAAPTAQYTPAPAAPAAAPPSADAQKALAELLKTKVTALDRAKELFVDKASGMVKSKADLASQLVFNFAGAKPATGELGGAKAAATVATFPWLSESDLSTTVLFLGPCGMNTPHVHPRGNEFLTAVNNTLEFGMILENGLVAAGKGTGEITGTLNAFQGTVFPKGSIHYQFNPTCYPTAAVAVLSDEDAGVNQVAQGFFGLNGEVVEASLGFPQVLEGAYIDQQRARIPLSLAKGVEECLAKCNIPKKR
jgi:hypothetical protein